MIYKVFPSLITFKVSQVCFGLRKLCFISSAKKHRKRDQFADFLVRKNVMQNSEKFLHSKAK